LESSKRELGRNHHITKAPILVREDSSMDELRTISAKIPDPVYKEMTLRVPEGDRSSFIRDAIMEKLQKTPKPDKISQLEQRMDKMEKEFSEIKKYLADLELLTYERGKMNPHTFGMDEIDHKMIDYLIHYKGATTPELADYLKTNRWLVLNRLRRIQKSSRKQLGKSIIEYYPGEKSGKKKAWWISEELVET
jgi:Arc/MetJ-type ribon-helix-helix transcriptional regulator